MSEESLRPTKPEDAAAAAAIPLRLVPGVGGALGAMASQIVARRQNRRMQGFLERLSHDLVQLEERIDRDFLETEEFFDLAEDVMTKAADSRQEEKLTALRTVFLNTLLEEDPSYDRAAEILALLDGWQPHHIMLLRILENPPAAEAALGHTVTAGGSIQSVLEELLPSWRPAEITRTWDALYDDRMHRTQGTRTMMSGSGVRVLSERLSPFGKEVAAYLHEPTALDPSR